jgi:gas vesicle protein
LRIGATTITAYRRVHEILASVLDFAARAAADESQWKTAYSRLVVELSRAKIMVNYQLARDQISQDIAALLNDVLSSIDSAVRNNQRDRMQERAERGRVLIDALAVLVYRFGKER